mmetsp:Transcript_33471/g.99751  ORF Transcript_33471/g.99751 Transcript_33471/m.99751 type:complete len:267 (-) Transcript_33471:472-1272(-)
MPFRRACLKLECFREMVFFFLLFFLIPLFVPPFSPRRSCCFDPSSAPPSTAPPPASAAAGAAALAPASRSTFDSPPFPPPSSRTLHPSHTITFRHSYAKSSPANRKVSNVLSSNSVEGLDRIGLVVTMIVSNSDRGGREESGTGRGRWGRGIPSSSSSVVDAPLATETPFRAASTARGSVPRRFVRRNLRTKHRLSCSSRLSSASSRYLHLHIISPLRAVKSPGSDRRTISFGPVVSSDKFQHSTSRNSGLLRDSREGDRSVMWAE